MKHGVGIVWERCVDCDGLPAYEVSAIDYQGYRDLCFMQEMVPSNIHVGGGIQVDDNGLHFQMSGGWLKRFFFEPRRVSLKPNDTVTYSLRNVRKIESWIHSRIAKATISLNGARRLI